MAERHIKRTDTAAGRSGERPFDADQVFAESSQGRFGQPVARLLERLFAGEYFVPMDLALTRISLGHRGVQDPNGSPPDIRPRSVALDKGDNRLRGDIQLTISDGDAAGAGGDRGTHGSKGDNKPCSGGWFQAYTIKEGGEKKRTPLRGSLI